MSEFGVCPCCEEIHKVIPKSELSPERRWRLMKSANPDAEWVMAGHVFGEYGSPCAAGSPFLLPPERLVDAP